MTSFIQFLFKFVLLPVREFLLNISRYFVGQNPLQAQFKFIIPFVTSFMQFLFEFVLFPFQQFLFKFYIRLYSIFLQVLFTDQMLFQSYSRYLFTFYSSFLFQLYSHFIPPIFHRLIFLLYADMDFSVYQQMNYQRTDHYNVQSDLCIIHSLDHDP